MSKIIIAGGSGLIGTRLSQLLAAQGHQVCHLSRKTTGREAFPTFRWDLGQQTIDPQALEGEEYIINLAVASIVGKHWTASQKQLIINSRTQANHTIEQAIRSGQLPALKAYLASAAIGYYGDRGEEMMTETASPGTSGFLPESCIAWEKAIHQVADTGVRMVMIRIGIVLSTQGGALPKMMMSTHARVGTYFGDGSMYYSWIHIDDLCQIFIHTLANDKLQGIFNGVAPNPVPNKELIAAIGKAKNKAMIMMPAPEFAIRLGMGEMADTVLHSTRVSAEKIQKTGFQFQFPSVVPALQDLFQRKI